MSDRVRTHVVQVAGVRSPVAERGPSEATEAVVFVHGNPGAGADWADLQGRLPEGVRSIAPDMPGFGGADAPDDFAYTVDGYAAHLGGLLDELGVERAHLVLHDFGGPWGLGWAAGHLERVGSLTLVNTGALVDYSWHHFAKVWRTPVVGEAFMALSFRPVLVRALGLENPRLPQDDLRRIAGQLTSRGTKRAVLRLYRATDPDDMAAEIEALRGLDAPVLVVWGTDDRYIPLVQAARQRRTFPQATVETLHGGGHWAFLEDPDRAASYVVPFLTAHVAV